MRTAFFIGIACVLIATSCFREDHCIRGEGNVETRTLELSPFSSIHLQGSMNVEIQYGDAQKVVAVGHGNIIDELETEVIDGIWYIGLGTGCFYNFDLKVYVTLPLLTRVSNNGSGDISILDMPGTDHLEIRNQGSGEIRLNSVSTTRVLDVKIQGSGPVSFYKPWNDLDSLNITVNSSGKCEAFLLPAPAVTVHSSGSGDIEVNATGTLKVTIMGSGDVFYKGDPEIELDDKGSGKLLKSLF